MAAEAIVSVKVIKPAELQHWMEQGRKLLVVDVQDAADVLAVGTIPGAVNISLGSLTYKADHGLPKEWRDFRLNDHGLVIITTFGMGPLGALGGKLL